MVRYTWCLDCSDGKRIIHIDRDSWVCFSIIPILQSVSDWVSFSLYTAHFSCNFPAASFFHWGERVECTERDRVRWCGDIKITDCATSQPDTTDCCSYSPGGGTTWRVGEDKNKICEAGKSVRW